MKWFRKSEASCSIGEKIYRGKVNQHQILIRKEPGEIFSILTNPDQLKRWCPMEQISVEKITPGEFSMGTKHHFKLRFRIQPEWDSEVIHLEKPHQIVSRFLNGIFEGGIEIWDLKKRESETEVTHTLVYRIRRWIYRIGWSLLGGEKKHNKLTETALKRLKSLLERD
ncbi:MAG: SRPBCC domain-containing protein [Thermodesulfobacteriota bacterium]